MYIVPSQLVRAAQSAVKAISGKLGVPLVPTQTTKISKSMLYSAYCNSKCAITTCTMVLKPALFAEIHSDMEILSTKDGWYAEKKVIHVKSKVISLNYTYF